MKKCEGTTKVNDDEWYTPRETADKVAAWLAERLDPGTPILCCADLLPDGSESEIPKAMRAAGFKRIRVTRDLPVITQDVQDWLPGEVIVTNPPFSLLVPFRNWAEASGARYCILSRPGAMRKCWSIPELGSSFKSTDGRGVSAAWMQNIADTTGYEGKAIDNCSDCVSKTPSVPGMSPYCNAGQDRPLYGWGTAVKMGIAGWFCKHKTDANGKKSFARFFDPNYTPAVDTEDAED